MLAAAALIQPLAWKLLYATGVALKSKKKKKKKKKKEKKSHVLKLLSVLSLGCYQALMSTASSGKITVYH